jgi:predicted dehydrogenase
MNTIKWGIIGCGQVTEVKSGPAFQKAQHSELVAVMRRSGDLARDYAQRHGVPKWYDDGEKLIHDPDVDAVYIATPPYAHKPYTLLCANAGKPVYVEKPMAMSFAEGQEMLNACRSADIPVFVAYYRRALPHFLKIKEWIDSSTIGEPRSMAMALYQPPLQQVDPGNLPWRVFPEISGGGLFVDLGSHMLDLLDYLLGPIREVCGFASNQGKQYPAEDSVSGSFVFESGAHGVGTWCFNSFARLDRTEIVGTKGKITYSTFTTDPVELITERGSQQFPVSSPPHIQQPLIQTIIEALNGVGDCPSMGESAARTDRVINHLLESYRKRNQG